MKKAYFVRHAKSSWADLSQKDIDRPLNKRGLRDAPMMAERLSHIRSSFDIVLCSAAQRTQETAEYFQKHLEFKEFRIESGLYHADEGTILNFLGDLDDKYQSVLFFGHNPGMTYLHNHFASQQIDNLPTCGIFSIYSSTSWNDVDTTNAKIGQLLYPKMFL